MKNLVKARYKDKWVNGYYFKHLEYMPSPLANDDAGPQYKHLLVIDGLSDWNLPVPIQKLEINPETVCRYSGINDQTGKHIFENDIITKKLLHPKYKRNPSYISNDWTTEVQYIVKYGEYMQDGSGGEYLGTVCLGWYAEVKEEFKCYYESFQWTTSILNIKNPIIIGNILEELKDEY